MNNLELQAQIAMDMFPRVAAETFIQAELDLFQNKYYTDGKEIIWCEKASNLSEEWVKLYLCFGRENNDYDLDINWAERLAEHGISIWDVVQDYANSEDEGIIRDENGDLFDWASQECFVEEAIDWAIRGSENYEDLLMQIEGEERQRLIDLAEDDFDYEYAKSLISDS